MNTTWKTISIFVSSTFKDMDAERDYIKYILLGKLNKKYNPKFINIQIVDLRLGINNYNTNEDEREERVLNICFNTIDNSRPFFIGLIGDRYGWVPDDNRWNSVFSRFADLNIITAEDGRNKSVTELEIMYGAIGGDRSNLERSLFFIRGNESYNGMPDDYKEFFCETENNSSSNRIEKLNALKAKILSAATKLEDKICFDYNVRWDNQTNRFVDLESFGELFYDNICKQIDLELTSSIVIPKTWQDQEELNVKYLHSRNIYNTITSFPIIDPLVAQINKGSSLLLCGESGCGKSIILSQLYDIFSNNTNFICLSTFVNTSPHSVSMQKSLVRWLEQIEKLLKVDCSDYESLLEENNKMKLIEIFQDIVKKHDSKKIIIFIDDLESIGNYSRDDLFLNWLQPNMILLATATESCVETITYYNKHIKVIDIKSSLSSENQDSYLDLLSKINYMELPAEIKEKLISCEQSPLYIRLVYNIFTNFSGQDFQKIRMIDARTDVDAIYKYQKELFEKLPNTTSELIIYFADNLLRNLNTDVTSVMALKYLAIAKGGISEDVMEKLIGDDWNVLSFHSTMNLINNYVWEDRTEKKWRFTNEAFAKAFAESDNELTAALYKRMGEILLELHPNNPLRLNFLSYYLFKAKQSRLIISNLIDLRDSVYIDDSFIKDNYSLAMPHIFREENIAELLYQISEPYNDAEKIAFYYTMYNYISKFKSYNERPELTEIIYNGVKKIELHNLPIKELYLYALLLLDFNLGENANSGDSTYAVTLNRLSIVEQASNAFMRCMELDGAYRDCKNMAIASSTKLLNLYIAEGKFDRMESIMNKINSITNL